MNQFRKMFGFLFLLLNAVVVPEMAAKTDDFSTWSLVKVNCGLSRNWGFVGYVEYRSKDNLKHSDRWTLSAMLNWKPVSCLTAEGGYALHYRYKGDGGWGVRNRYKLGLTGSVGWRNVKFSLRERLQRTVADGAAEDVLRSRLKASYAPKSWFVNPYFSVELFQPLGDDAFFTASRLRYRPGMAVKLSKKCSIDVFYCRQYEPKSCRNISSLFLLDMFHLCYYLNFH